MVGSKFFEKVLALENAIDSISNEDWKNHTKDWKNYLFNACLEVRKEAEKISGDIVKLENKHHILEKNMIRVIKCNDVLSSGMKEIINSLNSEGFTYEG